MRSTAAVAAASQTLVEQNDKDIHLVEFLHLVSTHGCGDLDPEPAIQLLEDTGWDVAEAFARLCGVSGGAMVQLATDGSQAQGGTVLTEREHLRLQQEEWDRELAASEAARQQEHAARRARRAEEHSLRRLSEHAVRASEGPAADSAVVQRPAARASAAVAAEAAAQGQDPLDILPLEALGLSPAHQALLFEDLEEFGHSPEDAWRQIAAMGTLMRTDFVDDDARLRAAMQRSADEAYSGGYSVPPADEAAMERVTTTSIYRASSGGRGSGAQSAAVGEEQCAICLNEFEDNDSLRTLRCAHRFHMACVDQWLSHSGQCPVCKRRVCDEE